VIAIGEIDCDCRAHAKEAMRECRRLCRQTDGFEIDELGCLVEEPGNSTIGKHQPRLRDRNQGGEVRRKNARSTSRAAIRAPDGEELNTLCGVRPEGGEGLCTRS
jgi:hypothetical protein